MHTPRTPLRMAITLSVLTLGLIVTNQSHAQTQASKDNAILNLQLQLAHLENDRRGIRLAAPRAGLAVSSIGLGLGSMLTGIGAALHKDESCFFICSEDESDLFDMRAMITSGAVVTAVSAAGLIASAVRLKQKIRRRARLEREIRNLHARGVHSVLGPPQAPSLVRF